MEGILMVMISIFRIFEGEGGGNRSRGRAAAAYTIKIDRSSVFTSTQKMLNILFYLNR